MILPQTTKLFSERINKLRAYLKSRRNLRKNESGGSVVEYALILGFALLLFIVIVGIVLSIVEWTDTNFQNLLSNI